MEMRTEKRREQSRSAAKCRRLTESEIYTKLAEVLPNVDQQTVYQSDRIGLLRLASMVCRTRRLMTQLFPWNSDKSNAVDTNGENFMDEISVTRCLDGFVIVVNKAGQMLYISAGSSASIGFTQIDLAGKYFRDYVHNEDWQSLCQRLRVSDSDSTSGQSSQTDSKTFFRMKTAMTPRGGRARKLTMAVYQPMQAYIVDPSEKLKSCTFDSKSPAGDEDIRIVYCTPFGLSPLQKSFSPSISNSGVACTRHEIDMRFRFCSDKLASALNYGCAKKLIGQSFYDLIYPADLPTVAREFKQMYKTGHIVTPYYRLATNTDGYVWAVTEAALLVQNIRGVTQKSVHCNHHILSGIESVPSIDPEAIIKRPIAEKSIPEISVPIQSKSETAPSPTVSTIAPLLQFNPRLGQFGLQDDRSENPYLGLLYGATANSMFMAAMGATFPFTPTSSQTAKLFSTKPYQLPPMLNPPSDLAQVFLNSQAMYMSRFQPYPMPTGILDAKSEDAISRCRRLDAKTIESFEGEANRKHRLDAKTIESFEVAMIKNELSVGD